MPTTSGKAVIHRALASESRQALLAVLRRNKTPLDAAEAAEAVGLQRSTARVHLDVLISAGLVTRRLEQRTTPGRPRVLYEAGRLPASSSDPRPADAGYQDLARVRGDGGCGAAMLAGSSVAVPFVSAVAGAFAVTQAIRIASAQAHHVGITGDVCDLRSVRAALGRTPDRISVPNMLATPTCVHR